MRLPVGVRRGGGAVAPWRSAVAAALEVVLALALATGVIAALQSTTPVAGLGIVYLLAVLALAIRRGEVPALVASVMSVLTLNFLFVTPRYRLEIAHSQDVVELIVLLIAAVVVGRLASVARQRAAEAEDRARVATAHKREAELLAETSAAILARENLSAQLETVGNRIRTAIGATDARVALEETASPLPTEDALPLPSRRRKAWLYVSGSEPYDRGLVGRLAAPIAGLVDLALDREEAAERVAEAAAAGRADAAKTAILHAISHDLRSPITAILTAASALRAADVTAQERSELLAAIEAESTRLARLVGDLLDLSRIEAGAVSPQADWCDLVDVAASAVQRFDGGHPIEWKLRSDLPLIRADAVQLERVLVNLIENAIKFSQPGAPVEITGGAGPAWVTVRVIDHGSGIPRRDRSRIFEPFFRGHTDSAGGSGLGLAICRGFVEANGGRIIVQSDVGQGTSFAVSFPLIHDPSVAEPALTTEGKG